MILIYLYLITIIGSQIVVGDKQTFAFAIDDSASMSDDIYQVKISAYKIFDAVTNSKRSQIEKTILVTFNNYADVDVHLPNAKLRTITNDSSVFTAEVGKLVAAHGGYDCPEYAMLGIQMALDNSFDYSYVFVFTDASAKDYLDVDKVIATAQKKQIKITFVLTGNCGNTYEPEYQAYVRIAKETSGEIFNLYRNEVGQILNYAANLVDAKKHDILSKVYPPGYGHHENITVDSATKNLVLTAVGTNPQINVTLPSGDTANLTDLVTTTNIKSVKVPDVKPGVHKAVFGSTSDTKLSVVGTTTVDFKHAFSSEELTSLDGAPKQPVPGTETHLLIDLWSEKDDVELNQAQILNEDDTVIETLPLDVIDQEKKIYATPLFNPPNHTFKIAIIGTNQTSHEEIKRIVHTPIKPQDSSLVVKTNKQPRIVIDRGPKINAEYDEPLKLVCKVNGYPKPTITWTDSSGAKLPAKESDFSLPYDYLGTLEIHKVNKNETYTCSASNDQGNDSKDIQIETKKKIYFNVLEKPKDTTIEYETAGTLACRIDANPPANINWFANGELISDDNKNFSINEDRFTLNIIHMEPNLVGKYKCEAKNDLETHLFECDVKISGLEAPKIDKKIREKKPTMGSGVDILCRATGRPKPKIKWFYRQATTGIFKDLKESSENYHINNVNPDKHTGTYRCTAENIVNTDTYDVELDVQYSPVIEKSAVSAVEKEGNLLTIPCNVRGSPKPHVQWYRNNVPLTGSPGYTIHSSDHKLSFKVSLNKAGDYKCTATNKVGATSKSTMVMVPPTIGVSADDLIKEVVLSRPLTLPCPATGYPAPSIEWKFTPSDISVSPVPSIRPSKDGANIPNVQLRQDGNYTCVAKNLGGSVDVTYTVKVLEPASIINKKISEIRVGRGKETEIICRVKGIPKPSIEWFYRTEGKLKFDKIKGSDEIYRISYTEDYHSGTYKCVANNKVNKDVHNTDLIVEYPPSIKKTEPVLTVKQGHIVEIPCIVAASPTASVQWFFNDERIFDSKARRIFRDNLIKFKSTLVYSGNYTCKAKNIHGDASKSTEVKVLAPPTIKVPDNTIINVELNTPIALPCEADGYPKPVIEWSFYPDDPRRAVLRHVKPNTKDEGGRFIAYAQENHQGRHICTATNEAGTSIIAYEVIILRKPKILNQYPSHKFYAVEGDMTLSIQCPAQGNPDPTVEWLKDDTLLAADDDYYNIDKYGTLFIRNVTRKSEGRYTCLAKNIVGFEKEDFEVQALPYPESGSASSIVRLSEGQTKQIRCNIRHSRTDLLRWYKDNVLIATGELEISDAIRDDAGSYTCRVSNWQNSWNRYVKVVVGHGPRFVSEEDEFVEYNEGGYAVLVCDAEADPAPKVTWWFNGRKLATTTMTNYFYMQLNNIGQYFCIVSNDIGVIRRAFKIASPDCLLNVETDFSGRNQPLLLSYNSKWPSLETVNGYIRIPRNEYITLVCPREFKNFDTDKVTVSCQGDSKYEYEGGLYSYMDFTCKEQHIPVMKSTGLKCLNTSANTEIIKIGYEAGSDFLDVYEVCLELNTREPLYTKNIMSQSLADVPKTSNHWLHKDIMPADVDTQFYCTPTTGLSVYEWRSWSVREECCFDKRQLVNPKDVLPGVPQLATFSYLNLAAHWGTCSTKNWDEMERRVRSLAKSTFDGLQIWTGVFHSSVLEQQPTYLWKVVQDLAEGASLAIIQVNIPDVSVKDAGEHILCRDICNNVKWMRYWIWRDVAEGYIYCCSLRDFETAFSYVGLFNSDRYGRVLQDATNLPASRLT